MLKGGLCGLLVATIVLSSFSVGRTLETIAAQRQNTTIMTSHSYSNSNDTGAANAVYTDSHTGKSIVYPSTWTPIPLGVTATDNFLVAFNDESGNPTMEFGGTPTTNQDPAIAVKNDLFGPAGLFDFKAPCVPNVRDTTIQGTTAAQFDWSCLVTAPNLFTPHNTGVAVVEHGHVIAIWWTPSLVPMNELQKSVASLLATSISSNTRAANSTRN